MSDLKVRPPREKEKSPPSEKRGRGTRRYLHGEASILWIASRKREWAGWLYGGGWENRNSKLEIRNSAGPSVGLRVKLGFKSRRDPFGYAQGEAALQKMEIWRALRQFASG